MFDLNGQSSGCQLGSLRCRSAGSFFYNMKPLCHYTKRPRQIHQIRKVCSRSVPPAPAPSSFCVICRVFVAIEMIAATTIQVSCEFCLDVNSTSSLFLLRLTPYINADFHSLRLLKPSLWGFVQSTTDGIRRFPAVSPRLPPNSLDSRARTIPFLTTTPASISYISHIYVQTQIHARCVLSPSFSHLSPIFKQQHQERTQSLAWPCLSPLLLPAEG